MASAKDSFEEAKFMKELVHLRDTQEAIQSLSAWCLKNKKSAYKIARCWLKVVKKVKTDQKMALFYLFNDVVQHSKRKNFNELIDRFQTVLKEAIPHLKEDNISPKVKRVIHIWSERGVFNDKFLTELTAILDAGAKSKNIDDIVDSFQPHQLCTQIKIMKALEDDTEYKLKSVTENADGNIDLVDFDDEKIRSNLKDRQHGNDYISQVEDSRKKLEAYIKAVDREITKRRQVKDLLDQAKKYYDSLYDEANIVTNAYTSFGKKVKNVQKKLDTKMQSELKSSPKKKRKKDSVESLLSQADLSPIPSPDYDAPSPEPDDQLTLKLPDEIDQDHQSGESTPPLPPMAPSASMDNNMSISEYLTQLATGDPSNGNYYFDSSYQDPPAATAWPAPKSAEDYSHEEPIPEWQIQTIDEEPPDETEVKEMQMVDMEVVNIDSAEEDQQQLSLQERLSNLAGVPLPPGPRPPPQPQPQPLMISQPPPFFDQRPPGGGPFRGHDNHGGHPRGHGGHGGFHGGHRGHHAGPRPPFRGSPRGGIRGGGRGGRGGGRGGFRGGPPRW